MEIILKCSLTVHQVGHKYINKYIIIKILFMYVYNELGNCIKYKFTEHALCHTIVVFYGPFFISLFKWTNTV